MCTGRWSKSVDVIHTSKVHEVLCLQADSTYALADVTESEVIYEIIADGRGITGSKPFAIVEVCSRRRLAWELRAAIPRK